MTREMKTFFGVALLTVFAFLMVNHIILSHPIGEWALAGVMFVLGAFFLIWASLPETQATEIIPHEARASDIQEWIISKDIDTDGKAQIKIADDDALPFDELAEDEAHA